MLIVMKPAIGVMLIAGFCVPIHCRGPTQSVCERIGERSGVSPPGGHDGR